MMVEPGPGAVRVAREVVMRGQRRVARADGSAGSENAVRLRLVAPLALLSQAVATALRSRGLQVEESPRGSTGCLSPRVRTDEPAVLLLMDDLTTEEAVRNALSLISSGRWRVLVLTGREPGRYWGALLAAGAASVMSSASSLHEVEAAVLALDAGEEAFDEEERRRLVADWQVFLRQQQEASARLARLSARERTVLAAMRSGTSVPRIAEQLEVAETTTRSQVKSILRKLDVRSQLAAVAVVHHQESPLVAGALATAPQVSRRCRLGLRP